MAHSKNYPQHSLTEKLKAFIQLEAFGGILLMIAAVAALCVANSPLAEWYDFVLHDLHFSIGFLSDSATHMTLNKSILHWINDGLMAIFFFLVGLEIKRELMHGELSSKDRALLPLIAAIGGVAIPALIFFAINYPYEENWRGWAIPTATDIAFALGVLMLLGPRVPLALKVLLTAIAIIDDLGAILIIAFFYSTGIDIPSLAVAGAACGVLFALNRAEVGSTAAYVMTGFVLWMALLHSGIHPTIGGVLTALAIPMKDEDGPEYTPVETLIHRLHPWVAYGILPLLGSPLTLGIVAGLVLGKTIGIFSFTMLAIKTPYCAELPDTNWKQILGMAMLCGIGFTMSLFIGELALPGGDNAVEIRLGVLGASTISAILGYTLLRSETNKPIA
jgi:NhaA family Na+:H+ antiporter